MQVDKILTRILSDGGSSDQPFERKLFKTNLNLNLVNTRILSTQQPTNITIMMSMNPFMVGVLTNVLCIQLPKYHDNDDPVIHIRQLTKVCMTNGEDMNNHKL
jgi:hypothetical protein